MSVSMDERLEMNFLTKMFTMFSRFCYLSTNQRKVLIWFYLELSRNWLKYDQLFILPSGQHLVTMLEYLYSKFNGTSLAIKGIIPDCDILKIRLEKYLF